jgi:hypothetical protein
MKYKFTGKTKEYQNKTLHEIEAVRDFGNVKKGAIGGWIEKESNLSHEGECWVAGNAKVFGNALVYGDAWVYGNAKVFGNALVYGDAWVYGNAQVFGDAKVFGNAQVFGDAWVYGYAEVFGNGVVSGDTLVFGDTLGKKNQNLPEELNELSSAFEEVLFNGKKYKRVTKWEEVSE